MMSLKIGIDSHDRIAANILTGLDLSGKGVIFNDENHKKLMAYLLNDSNIQELSF
jgi:putative Mg2+ transporter-C (MgtC) family protein